MCALFSVGQFKDPEALDEPQTFFEAVTMCVGRRYKQAMYSTFALTFAEWFLAASSSLLLCFNCKDFREKSEEIKQHMDNVGMDNNHLTFLF